MFRSSRFTLSVLAAVLFANVLATRPVSAEDASCQPVVSAMMKLANTSYHASITFDGKPGGDEIYTTTAIYRGLAGHWGKIPASPQERIDANRAVGASLSNCHQIRKEVVDGQSATVYAAQTHTASPPSSGDIQMWIGQSRGLPLKVESNVQMFGKKSHTSQRYDYNNVQPPAGVK
ncbi:MAG: hypothetical protein ABI132_02620 [Rhodanobacteraceae bacterium]